MGAIGAMGAAGSVAFADEAEVADDAFGVDEDFVPGGGSFAEGMLDLGWTGTPPEVAALGGSTMPLAELNRRRQAYIDSQTDYTCEDGTVIPAVYVKMRALIHSYGMGCGNTPRDNSFDDVMAKFTEDEAQAFLDMPMGEKFTAIDLYEKTGRPLDECKELCEHAADAGYLCRFTTNNGITYHHAPFFQGVVEYHLADAIAQPGYNTGIVGADMVGENSDMGTTGTPVFYAIPCDKSVVADETVLPFDDVEAIIASKGKLAIAPCYCRYTALGRSGAEDIPTFEDFATGEFEEYFSPLCDHRVETCLMMGDEAEYWIHMGLAREISQEDALRYMKRSCDDGFVLQSCFTKDTGTICSCSIAGSCGILASNWASLGSAEAIGASKPYGQISHYNLEVDLDKCIQCGTCAARCPLETITMDEETGYPVVGPNCFRCGQCAYVCPQEARQLVARPEEQNIELPRDFLDDGNMKAAYRFEHGLIF